MASTLDQHQTMRATSVMLLPGASMVCAIALFIIPTLHDMAPVVNTFPQLAAISVCCAAITYALINATLFCLHGNVGGKARPQWEWACVVLGLACAWMTTQMFWDILQLH